MPSGQDAFVAIATACFLYERYAVAILISQGKKGDRARKVSQLGKDFNVDEETAEAFWKVIRDGMLHQGMPLQVKDLPAWSFDLLRSSGSFPWATISSVPA